MSCDCGCKDGERGPMGLQGPQGLQGEPGSVGGQGAQGQKGLQGIQGIPGDDGLTGHQGSIGPKGDSGLPGIPGIDGLPGPRGIDGINGSDGATGPDGPAGPKGDTGATGIQGPQGVQAVTTSLLAEGLPTAVVATASVLGSTRLCDAGATAQVITTRYDNVGGYDSTTGIWTCPSTGIYNVSYYLHMIQAAGWGTGKIIAGLVDAISCNTYCVNITEGTATLDFIDISGSIIGLDINAGEQLVLKVMNLSASGYTPVAGDIARVGIQKIA